MHHAKTFHAGSMLHAKKRHATQWIHAIHFCRTAGLKN